MKKPYLTLLFLLAFTTTAFTQTFPTNVVKTNPFGFFVGQYQFGYEAALTDNISMQVQAGVLAGSGDASLIDSTGNTITAQISRSGFILIPEVRYYPSWSACEGFYIAASGRFRRAKAKIEEELLYERNVSGGAVTIGYQMNKNGFIIDSFIGAQIKNVDTDWFDQDTSESTTGLFGDSTGAGVRFGISLGYGF